MSKSYFAKKLLVVIGYGAITIGPTLFFWFRKKISEFNPEMYE